MTFEIALGIGKTSTYKIAKIFADSLDDDFKKNKKEILDKINEHKKAIEKLELELDTITNEAALRWLPAAERKKKEAEDYVYNAIASEMKERKRGS